MKIGSLTLAVSASLQLYFIVISSILTMAHPHLGPRSLNGHHDNTQPLKSVAQAAILSTDCDSSETPSSFNTSSLPTATVVRDYYDSIGDWSILREQIYNLESEMQREKFIQDRRLAAGKTLDPPDSQFIFEYFKEREKLVKEYFLARTKTDTILQNCQDEGLDVQLPNTEPTSFDQSFNKHKENFLLKKSKSLYATRSRYNHIAHWIWIVQRESRSGSTQQVETVLGDLEAEKFPSDPNYSQLQGFTKIETSTINQLIDPFIPSDSFQGEAPVNGRRYSSPDLAIVSIRTPDSILGLKDIETIKNPLCKSDC
jgi:hypothetical protein